jgi:AcrR family transcriptional regulator
VLVAASRSSLREQKKQATRQAIHEAALSLTEELGLATVTVAAIVDRADVSVRTFFNYFPSKSHAVLGGDPDLTARLTRGLTGRPVDEAPLEALREVLTDDFIPPGMTPQGLLRRFRVIHSEPTLLATLQSEFAEVGQALTTAVAQRLPEADPLYTSLVVAAAITAMRISLLSWDEASGKGPLDPFVGRAFDQLAAGLVPPPGGSRRRR